MKPNAGSSAADVTDGVITNPVHAVVENFIVKSAWELLRLDDRSIHSSGGVNWLFFLAPWSGVRRCALGGKEAGLSRAHNLPEVTFDVVRHEQTRR